MSIVSDASPLISLARIGKLDLLSRLYGAVLLPGAVWEEVVVRGRERPGASAIETADWVEQRTVQNRPLVRALRQDLDPGEAEAIALAVEVGPEFLLMDERHGRETAQHLGIACVGVVGVIIEAKHSGHVAAVKPLLDMLRQEAGFYISDALYRRILHDEGEA